MSSLSLGQCEASRAFVRASGRRCNARGTERHEEEEQENRSTFLLLHSWFPFALCCLRHWNKTRAFSVYLIHFVFRVEILKKSKCGNGGIEPSADIRHGTTVCSTAAVPILHCRATYSCPSLLLFVHSTSAAPLRPPRPSRSYQTPC